MIDWLLGIEATRAAGEGGWTLEWGGPGSGDQAVLWLLAAVGVAWLVIWLYRREQAGLSRLAQLGMGGLRLTAWLAAAAMWMEPVAVAPVRVQSPSVLPILVDASASMSLADVASSVVVDDSGASAAGVDEASAFMSRFEAARRVLSPAMLADLEAGDERRAAVQVFGTSLEEGDLTAARPEAPGTAVAGAVREALARSRGRSLAGLVLVTDGQSNMGPPMVEAGRLAAEAGVAIHAIAVGTASGPRNVTVRELAAEPIALVDDPFALSATFEARGYEGASATLRLERSFEGGPWASVDERTVELASDGAASTARFEVAESTPGQAAYRVVMASLEGETTPDDNAADAMVQIARPELRVLLIAGHAFPEVQFLRNTLYQLRTVSLSSWVQDALPGYDHPGDAPIRRLPRTPAELDAYDVVVLYDPDVSALPEGFVDNLRGFVGQAAGGLVVIAGEAHTADWFDDSADAASRGLAAMLPVTREAGAFRSEVSVALSSQHAWRMELTGEGEADPIFAFEEDPQANARVLQHLPGMYWHFPVTRAKPGATVLVRHGDPRMRNSHGRHVVMASHRFGPGMVMFIGFDSTYRWRYLDESLFDGFWSRVTAKVGRAKQLGGSLPFRLRTDRSVYEPGGRVRLEAAWRRVEELDPGLTRLEATIEHADGSAAAVTLTPAADRPGVFEATFPADRVGAWGVRATLGDAPGLNGGSTLTAAVTRFRVELRGIEFERPGADRSALEELAVMTGGRVFEVNQADQLAGALTVGRAERVFERRYPLWNAPLFLILVLAPVLVEWVLRKRLNLV